MQEERCDAHTEQRIWLQACVWEGIADAWKSFRRRPPQTDGQHQQLKDDRRSTCHVLQLNFGTQVRTVLYLLYHTCSIEMPGQVAVKSILGAVAFEDQADKPWHGCYILT